MRTIIIVACLLSSEMAQAITKSEFMKLSPKEKQKCAVVIGMPPDYAIPIEDALKLPFEVRNTMSLEIERERALYLIQNIGKRYGDLDVSRLYNLGMIDGEWYQNRDKNILVSYGAVCGAYRRYENHLAALPYCRKHYHEWKKHEQGQSSLWDHSSGDNDPLTGMVGLCNEFDMYQEWDALYADYNDFWWKRYAAAECRLRTDAGPDCVEKWLEEAEDYQAFLEQWTEIKQKAKTVKPKPLPIPVQMHEDFYSADVKKVLGALEYYSKHKVRFMVEKALKDKRPDVAQKAQEYLDNWDKPADSVVVSTAPEIGAK